ncbi:tetratricopeptide repeat protein [Streptomyces sp. NRRL S-244]|uniref:tetratricopeptide repeat protein n=1 Tax=Streptomyces sp. NRRL S-244 TaxID=1463897 RepID=UPI00068E6742|nr:tetratricopeptide repeat protein [Streptomyces sp. NRRL S-244]
MAGRGPSRQELIRRRRSSGFIGRQGEIAAFRDALRQPPDEAAQFLFHVRGPAGVGKSTLVRQLETVAREGQAVTAYVDESVADVVETMEVISAQFAQQGVALKGFDKLLATYRQRRHEADAGMATAAAGADAAAGGSPAPSPSSVIASQLGLVGLGMLPGVGAFTGAVDPNQVAAGADRVKALLSTRLRSHGDVELVLSPLDALTPVFLEELGEAARKHPWITLFFDTYERTGPMLDTWLRDVLGSDRYGELPANVLVTLAGQSRLAARCWEDWHDLVTDWPLEVFTDAEARRLLAGKDVTNERVVEVILQLSGRLPVLVSTLAETQPGSVEEIGDPSGTAVERFLKWEADPARRAAALACAFPQELDEDVFRAAVEEEAAELFGWLRSMPFVTDRSGHCRYHEVVRSAMLRLQRRQSPARWELLHTRLADAFRLRRERLEETAAPADGWWSDETWRGHRLQETYHRLCADPRAALPAAMRELVDAYDHGVTTLRRWVQVLIQAGRDTQGTELTDWGERLRTALEHRDAGVATLTLLLSRGALDTTGQAHALTLRGRDHRKAERYPEALADYARALALDPGAKRAHFGRGRTHELTERFEEAIGDYTRAIALDPGHAWSIGSRGVCHRNTGRYEEALADFDRVLDLTPDDHRTFTHRGVLHRITERYDEALADFTRAIEIKPNSAWALANRGYVLSSTGRHEEASADLDRAIEIFPDYAWPYVIRGRNHRGRARYEEALIDYTRAIELRPDYSSALAGRGEVFRLTARYEKAMGDLTRAIALRADYAWALASRGAIHGLMQRHEQALEDFDRAIELDPTYGWALKRRGLALLLLGRHEAALADLTRAIELGADDAWVLSRRGDVFRRLGRCEEALADYTRADELEPGSVETLARQGLTRRLLGQYEEALADLTRAIALEPDQAWTHYETAVVLHALGHPDRDRHLARAVELLTPNGAPTVGGSAADIGNLVLAHCVWPHWEQAGQHFAEFLAKAPPPGQMHELLVALRSLIPVIPSAESRIEELCRAVEGRLDAPS